MESATGSTRRPWSRKLRVQFLVPTLVALAVVLAAGPLLAVLLERFYVATISARLLREAKLLGSVLPWTSGEPLDRACAERARALGARVTVIAPDGLVLGESARPSAGMEDHAGREEVREALANGTGEARRLSTTTGLLFLYRAWRQHDRAGDRIVRVALPITGIRSTVRQVRRLVILTTVAAAALALIPALLLSSGMLRRLGRMVAFSRAVAAGEAVPELKPAADDEVGELERHLAASAAQVAATITALRAERERLEAILRGMVGGVVVTSSRGEVTLANDRARELLGLPGDLDVEGRLLVELCRHPGLQELTREALLEGRTRKIVGRELRFGPPERVLQVNVAPVEPPSAGGDGFGSVFVFHDITELRRLEAVRREFVANVSHELRTPLTAIRGYAETLLGPAGKDPELLRRYLEVIDRNAERLSRLTEDLLTLSDIELGRLPVEPVPVDLRGAAADVAETLASRAAEARIKLEAPNRQGGPVMALADPDRLQQILLNLADNALKFTGPGGRVALDVVPRAEPTPAAIATGRPVVTFRFASKPPAQGWVAVSVEDSGSGIPASDLPRLTERFYRVDRARSRALGGTGLGLAIVKHLVEAHHGWLEIESAPGEGTTVRVAFTAAG